MGKKGDGMKLKELKELVDEAMEVNPDMAVLGTVNTDVDKIQGILRLGYVAKNKRYLDLQFTD